MLLGLWLNASVQKELEEAKRSKTVFLRIAKEINQLGYERTWQQCRVKVKNIVSNYVKITGSSKIQAKKFSFSSSSTLFAVFTPIYCIYHCARQRSM